MGYPVPDEDIPGPDDDYDFVAAYKKFLEERPYYKPDPRMLAPSLPDPADQGLPEAEDPGGVDDDRPEPAEHRYSRQVGLRLSLEDYDDLSRAADEYGVAPTTLARMLVRRGVRAILRPR